MRRTSWAALWRETRKAFPVETARIEQLEKQCASLKKLCRVIELKERLKKLKARDRKLSRSYAARHHKKSGA